MAGLYSVVGQKSCSSAMLFVSDKKSRFAQQTSFHNNFTAHSAV